MSLDLSTQAPSVNWSPRLALDVALNIYSPVEVCARHNLTVDEFNAVLCTPAFAHSVEKLRGELHEKGEVFRAKARVQAELLLDKSFELVNRVDTPASVKADLIKATVEWAGLKPKGSSDAVGGSFNITFNIPLPSGRPAADLPQAAPKRAAVTIENV